MMYPVGHMYTVHTIPSGGNNIKLRGTNSDNVATSHGVMELAHRSLRQISVKTTFDAAATTTNGIRSVFLSVVIFFTKIGRRGAPS